MGFYERYELLELDRDDGVKTFQAREVATGRPVKVHLFAAPAAPYQAHLLAKIDQLPEPERGRILDRGNHLGTRFVVTDRLADHAGLFEWISASLKGKTPAAGEERAFREGSVKGQATPLAATPPRINIVVPAPSAPTPPVPIPSIPNPSGPVAAGPVAARSVAPQDSELNREFASLFNTAERPVFKARAEAPPRPAGAALNPSSAGNASSGWSVPSPASSAGNARSAGPQETRPGAVPRAAVSNLDTTKILLVAAIAAVGILALAMVLMLLRRH